jgi:hypothetical protein
MISSIHNINYFRFINPILPYPPSLGNIEALLFLDTTPIWLYLRTTKNKGER